MVICTPLPLQLNIEKHNLAMKRWWFQWGETMGSDGNGVQNTHVGRLVMPPIPSMLGGLTDS